jgi:hypothetical protein
MSDPAQLPDVDVGRAHPARVYNYWLGGKDHYAVDREVGDAMARQLPSLPVMARAHRRFLERAVRYLVAEAGIRQFVHVASGMPTTHNLHQIAQELDPTARIVFVDDDPVIAAHSRALLISDPKGAVSFVQGTIGHVRGLLDDPEMVGTLDLDEPVAVGLSSTLMRFTDDEAREILDTLLDAIAVGSYLTVTHPTADFDPQAVRGVMQVDGASQLEQRTRTQAQVAAFLTGLELVEPGVVPILAWRPDIDGPQRDPRSVHILGGMARKP